MSKLIKTIYIIFLIYSISFAQEQKSLIEINSAVDTSTITIGDRITYSVSIDYDDSLQVEHPGAGVNLGQFEIKDYKIYDPVQEDDRILQKYEYVISVFDTGSYIIPPFPIAYFPKDSVQNYKIIEASAINIYVESILGEGEKELKDVKAPINIPFDYFLLVLIGAIIILIALAGFFWYRFYKLKKERGYFIKAPEPKRPAHEIALEALQLLAQKDLVKEGKIKQYYTEISEIIRRYLEDRYFIRALEETSAEILSDIQSQEIEKEYINSLDQLLNLSDLVKFAKHIPGSEENEEIYNKSIEFVENTKIVFLQSENKEEMQEENLIEQSE